MSPVVLGRARGLKSRATRGTLFALSATAFALAIGCGSEGVQVEDRGAQLFAERCAGCHTLRAAGTQGTISGGVRPTGPNLNKRKLTKDEALFAIRNGGFSGAIMPQNIVVGEDAEAVAEFLAKYAGSEATGPPSPTGGETESAPEGSE